MSEMVQPGSAEELREIVAAALAEDRPLEIAGGGTKRGFGRPVEASQVVSLERLTGIDLYEPEELVMRAGAGTPLAEIEQMLDAHQQQLAFEPADYGAILGGEPARGTIGAVFACNLSGPRRLKSGAARDHFLGLEAVTGRGDVIKSGGRVMKNVTGYDLCKLLAGSFGTLAAMTRVTFKVLPAPEATATLALIGLDAGAGGRALRATVGSAYEIAGAAWLPASAASRSGLGEIAGAGRDVALVRVEGTGPSVDYRLEALERIAAPFDAELLQLETADSVRLWREVRDVALLPRDEVLWRVSTAPTAGPELLAALAGQLGFEAMADWAGGLLWLRTEPGGDGGAAAIRAQLAVHGGHATLVRAPADLRARITVFQPQPAPLAALSRRVKTSFDPERILNRGRMFPDV